MQVGAVEAATVKTATKAQELEGALSELQSAMLQLGKSTGTKPPTVRAASGGGGGAVPIPCGSYVPLPAVCPPFALSAGAPANKVGPGGPHVEAFTVVRTLHQLVLLVLLC